MIYVFKTSVETEKDILDLAYDLTAYCTPVNGISTYRIAIVSYVLIRKSKMQRPSSHSCRIRVLTVKSYPTSPLTIGNHKFHIPDIDLII